MRSDSRLTVQSSGYETNGTQVLDYRLAEGNPDVESWFRGYLGNVTAYQGGFDGAASATASPIAFALALALASICLTSLLA